MSQNGTPVGSPPPLLSPEITSAADRGDYLEVHVREGGQLRRYRFNGRRIHMSVYDIESHQELGGFEFTFDRGSIAPWNRTEKPS